MRIVGGSLGGRVLRAPRGATTRPTSEKVREALFQILGDVTGAHVLDLFAGSGALGIEAISRGAAHATFVDSGKPALGAIRANLAELGIGSDRATVIAGDATRIPAGTASAGTASAGTASAGTASTTRNELPRWRVVFIDPPYASDLAIRAASALPPARLDDGAVIVIEHDRRGVPPDALGNLLRTDQRRYGDTLISFYEVRA